MRLSRYKALTVRKPLKRNSKIKNANRRRKAKEWVRAYGSEDRVQWVASLPCCVTGLTGLIENAHAVGGGAGRKADACWIVPLHRDMHAVLHRVGIETFEKRFKVDLQTIAETTEMAWQRHINRSETP